MGATAHLKPITAAEEADLLARPEDMEDILFPDDEEDPSVGEADLDKAWHAIHYVLTGSGGPDGTPLGDAVLGGEAFGPDLGYGRARIVPARRVAEISAALQQLDFAAAFERVDKSPQRLERIYLADDLVSEYEYIAHWYPALVEVYARASADGNAMLIYLA